MKPEQITAWALNEASAEECQQLEAELRENPKAKHAAEETKDFCHFLLAELRDESLALTDEQREKLKMQPVAQESRLPHASGTLAPRSKWRTGIVVRLALAACVALGGFWTWHAFETSKQTTPAMAAVDEEKYQIQPGRRSEIDKLEQSASAVRRLAEAPVETPVIEKKMQRVTGKPPAPAPLAESTPAARPLALNRDQGTMTPGDIAELKKIQDQNAYGLNFGDKRAPATELPAMRPASAGMPASGPVAVGQNVTTTYSGVISGSGGIAKDGAGVWTLNGANTFTGGTTVNGGTLMVGNTVTGTTVPVDLMTDLTVTTKSGTGATMKVTREFSQTSAAPAPTSATASQPGLIAGAGTSGLTIVGSSSPGTSSSVGMTKVGTGTLTLSSANTLSGNTTPNAGKVIINGGAIMPQAPSSAESPKITFAAAATPNQTPVATGPLSLASDAPMPAYAGATLDLNGLSQTTGTIKGDAAKKPEASQAAASNMGSTATATGATLDLATASGSTFTGNTTTNQATLTLSGAITYTGGTKVKAVSDHSRTKMLSSVDEKWEDKAPTTDAYYFNNTLTTDREQESVRAGWAVQKDARSAGESYTRIIENELKDVAREPLSTFSIDVDTASYANVRRFLNQGMIPPPDAVRIEELVNYFPTAEEGPAHDAKEPFAVRVELAPCPWQPVHRLARIGIKGRELGNERKASNLVFLVDVSGSMNEPNKLPLVQQSLRMLTEQLGEGDRVTMVVYAGSSGLVLPPTNGEKKGEILAAIDKLQAGGSTHGSAGIQLAYEQAVACFIKGGVNRVILCTDGDFNVGVSSPGELEKLITKKAKSGVFLSVLGFGSGNLKDRTMETLADKGNGNYAYIDSLSEARKVLVEQMSGTLVTIAKDVKIQVEFNPAAVRSYRLIGYENRMLAKEDFNDDTKDAGEIGAGHSVVALYEVVPANLPPGAEPRPAVDSLKYQAPAIAPAKLAEAAKSGEMMTVKLRYKAPDSDLSKLIEMPVKDEGKTLTASSEEYKFSAAVAGFGLLLRDSAYKGALSWETVRRLALDGKGADKLGYRGEFLQLIDKARGLKETRP